MAKRKFQTAEISDAGITFYPSPLRFQRDQLRAFWVAQAPTGDKLFFVGLKSPMFVPYFGTAGAFLKPLALTPSSEGKS